MLVHHVKYLDGRIEHREFSKQDWEWAMHDPEVVDHWGHRPDRCVDPIADVRRDQVASPPKEVFVPRAILIAEKREQIKKIVESVGGQMSMFE